MPRASLPSAPEAEQRIRELSRAGHDAMLRVRWLEGWSGIPVVHAHVRVDNFTASGNIDELGVRRGHFELLVDKLIDICLRQPEAQYDPHKCDCLAH